MRNCALEGRDRELLNRERARARRGRGGTGTWNLYELERRVATTHAPSQQLAERHATLVALRECGDYERDLRASFDSLAEDVFPDVRT